MGPSRRLALLLARIGEARHFTARRTVCLLGESCSPGPAMSILVHAMLHGSGLHCRYNQACSHALSSCTLLSCRSTACGWKKCQMPQHRHLLPIQTSSAPCATTEQCSAIAPSSWLCLGRPTSPHRDGDASALTNHVSGEASCLDSKGHASIRLQVHISAILQGPSMPLSLA